MSRTASTAHRIYLEIKNKIDNDLMISGEKMLSSREMAKHYKVSRTTVTTVYERLAAEGYLITAAGKVATIVKSIRNSETKKKPHGVTPGPEHNEHLSGYGQFINSLFFYKTSTAEARIDFNYATTNHLNVPSQPLKKMYKNVAIKDYSTLNYRGSEGEETLRTAIVNYVRRAKGILCSAYQVLIINGAQQGIDLCARILLETGDNFVFEEPGYTYARYCLQATGANAVTVPVDEEGLVTSLLPSSSSVRMAYTTPSHQFPLGGTLSYRRRCELLSWSVAHNAWIVEDDYASEFFYDSQKQPALFSLDKDERVIYVGTFSKILSPQFRLGYLILPESLVPVFRKAKMLMDRQSTSWNQQALASFINDGSYEIHIKKVIKMAIEKRGVLLNSIRQYMPETVSIRGFNAGLHVVIECNNLDARDELIIQDMCLQRAVGIYPLTPFFLNMQYQGHPRIAAFVMGYYNLSHKEIQDGVSIVADVIKDVVKHKSR